MRKKFKWLGLFLGILLIASGVYFVGFRKNAGNIEKKKREKSYQELIENVIVKYNQTDTYFNLSSGEKVPVQASLIDGNHFRIFYSYGDTKEEYEFMIANDILVSNQYIEAFMLEPLMRVLFENKQDPFLLLISTNTYMDYTLEKDGISLTHSKEGNLYKLELHLNKDFVSRDFIHPVITKDDYESGFLKVEYEGLPYFKKGYLIYKEKVDISGNKVVTFGQGEAGELQDNLIESIANYIETYHSVSLKEDFLEHYSLESLDTDSVFTSENYTLDTDYLVFKTTEVDPYFTSYFKNYYKSIVLVLKPKA